MMRVGMILLSAVFAVQAFWIARDASLYPVSRILGAMLLSCLAVMGSPIYPLLRFKPDQRTLEIGPDGISTTIGRRSGKVQWTQVARIVTDSGHLYILGKSGNSFVVPLTAFSNNAERSQFIELATRWLHEAA
jgi:YcxB-like protein